MENKYSEKAANVLLHLHPASHAHHHPEQDPNPVDHCRECGANMEDIVGNEDRRRAKLRQRFIALVKVTQRAVQNIFNINIARLQVSIVEMAILLA